METDFFSIYRAEYEKTLIKGISFAPGAIFSPRQKHRNFLCLNAATWTDAVQDAIKTLGALAGK